MDSWLMWLVLSTAGLLILALAVVLVVVLRLCKGVLESLRPVLIRQLELVDKATTLAASRDVAAYQGIQAMQMHPVGYDDDYDPSDEAEAIREAKRLGIDPEDIGGEDAERLRSLF